MSEPMFCLACMSWEPVVNGGHMIYLPPFEDEPAEIDWCDGPFTYSEPPEDDFMLMPLSEPDDEEFERINQDARLFWEAQ